MATAYTTYTATAKITFRYHYVCEHCGKDSGMLASEVKGIDSINISGKGQPTPAQQAVLQAGAQSNAVAALRAKIAGAEKGKYGEGIRSKCPLCGKTQSWELKSGRWKPLWNALQGLIVGFLIMLIVSFFGGNKAGGAVVICIPILASAGLVWGLVGRARAKIDSSKTTNRNKPEFIWPNVGGVAVASGAAMGNKLTGQSARCLQCGAAITFQDGAALAMQYGHSKKVMCGKCQSVFSVQLTPGSMTLIR
jgi:hypothetical protein